MSKMKELAYDIEQMFIEGHSPDNIASTLKISLNMVADYIGSYTTPNDYDPPADAKEAS